jgi:hypothetical protein
VPATVFYAACVAAAGLAELVIWLYAIRADLVLPSVTPELHRYFAARMLRTPVVFGLSNSREETPDLNSPRRAQ